MIQAVKLPTQFLNLKVNKTIGWVKIFGILGFIFYIDLTILYLIKVKSLIIKFQDSDQKILVPA